MRLAAGILVSLVLLPTSLAGQEPDPGFVLRLETELVVRAVSVRDRDGLPITDLTPEDFVVTEDGVPQMIRVFEFHEFDDASAVSTPAASEETPASAGDPYRDKRLLAFYFDLVGMSHPERTRTFAAARRFVTEQMTAADLIAIFAYSGGTVARLREFTADRNDLLASLRSLEGSPDPAGTVSPRSGHVRDNFDIFSSDRRLMALETTASALGRIWQAKSLIYFSGANLDIRNQAQLRATLNAAVRANVSVFPIDSRGLAAFAPIGSAGRSSPGGIAAFTTSATISTMSAFQQSQDSLYTLAADTGGRAFLDSNDLTAGIVSAQRAASAYYVIGYYPMNRGRDGHLRRVGIELVNRYGSLSYQNSYYARKDFSQYTTAERERQLEEALLLGDPVTDIMLLVESGYFRASETEYLVPVWVRIPGDEFDPAQGTEGGRTRIDVAGEVRNADGFVVARLRDRVDIGLYRDAQVSPRSTPVQYETAFTLEPGAYTLRLVVRNGNAGRMGTWQSPFTVPSLTPRPGELPISSVVMANRWTDPNEIPFDAGSDTGQVRNPLIERGQQLVPNVGRVFRKEQPLYVYLEAYPATYGRGDRVVAFVTCYRDQERVFESHGFPASLGADEGPEALPFRIAIPPSQLPVGELTFQISILRPYSREFAFWRTRLQITD